jgi:hypothetical protein
MAGILILSQLVLKTCTLEGSLGIEAAQKAQKSIAGRLAEATRKHRVRSRGKRNAVCK